MQKQQKQQHVDAAAYAPMQHMLQLSWCKLPTCTKMGSSSNACCFMEGLMLISHVMDVLNNMRTYRHSEV
jgi:hypothetical protein